MNATGASAARPQTARQVWMGQLAQAPAARLAALWAALDWTVAHDWLRRPEIGTVMVRGRMGGDGRAFNMGEVSVTRASVRLEDGTVGHAYVQGRDGQKAEIAALIDALMQTGRAGAVRAAVLDQLAADQQVARAERAAKAAATKVDFFTLVRGED